MKTWLEINAILISTYLLFFFFRPFFNLTGRFKFEADCFKALVVMGFFPLLSNFFPIEVPLPPVLTKQISSAFRPSLETIQAIQIRIPSQAYQSEYQFNWTLFLALAMSLGFTIWLIRFIKDVYAIRTMMSESILIKKQGKIKLYCSPNLKVPCSFWFPGNYIALFPENVMLDKTLYSHALSHELQHHRQFDTKLIYILEFLKALFFLNPFTHLWISRIHENRELQCDKEVLNRKGYLANEYGNTLIDVVKINSGKVLHRTWAMASLTKIQRRIKMIKFTKKGHFDWLKRIVCIGLTLTLTWQTLAATKNFTGMSKLTLIEAEELVQRIDSSFPIEVNKTVLKWLNYFISDPKGKAYMIKSFERMHNYQKFLDEKLKTANMPTELLAVPFMESGYNNSHVSSMKAAGIWQFMPGTARRYGLKVNKKIDERLNVDLLTNAAISYYSDLMSIEEFDNDWRLAILAYNCGENRLAAAMKEQGTKNPWALKDVGDKEYLAKVMAGIILLKNPDSTVLMNPLPSGRTTSSYGKRFTKIKGQQYHRGIDIAARAGTPILSPLSGKVRSAEYKKGFGKSVIIDHGNNIETRYYHLQDFFVKEGQVLQAKDKIASVGNTGLSTGPHLHFEVLINGKNVDPEIFF